MKIDHLIIQFAKFPQAGKVKTRLHTTLGETGCYDLHQRLTRHVACRLLSSSYFSVLAMDKLADHPMLDSPLSNLPLIIQRGADLGERMQNALTWGLAKAKKVIIVGSDCPVLESAHYREALKALENHSHVFYPAEDGGYVLIGATVVEPRIFQNMPWGTQDVMAITQARLNTTSHTVNYLETLWDVDVKADLDRCTQFFPELVEGLIRQAS